MVRCGAVLCCVVRCGAVRCDCGCVPPSLRARMRPESEGWVHWQIRAWRTARAQLTSYLWGHSPVAAAATSAVAAIRWLASRPALSVACSVCIGGPRLTRRPLPSCSSAEGASEGCEGQAAHARYEQSCGAKSMALSGGLAQRTGTAGGTRKGTTDGGDETQPNWSAAWGLFTRWGTVVSASPKVTSVMGALRRGLAHVIAGATGC